MNLEKCYRMLADAQHLFSQNKYEEIKEILFIIERYVYSIEQTEEYHSPDIERNGIFYHAQCLILRGHISYRYGDISSSVEYYKKAQTLSQGHRLKWLYGKALGSIGTAYLIVSEYKLALEYYTQALPYFDELSRRNEYAKVLGNIGNCYTYLSDFSQAISCHKQALAIHEELGIVEDIAREIANIGNIYFNMEDYDNSLTYLEKAQSMLDDISDKQLPSLVYTNIGNVYMNRKKGKEALQYYEKALALAEISGHKHDISTILGNMGLTYTLLEDYQMAFQCHKKAQSMSETIGEVAGIAFNIACLGFLLSKPIYPVYNPVLAEQYLTKAIHLFEEIGIKKEQYECHKDLAALYKHIHKWENYAFHLEKYFEIKYDIQNEDVRRESERFIREREYAFKERERNLLLERNNALEQANIFKTKLLGIAAHDLKNPLGNILGATGIIREDSSNQDSILEWLEVIEESARRMSELIKDLLESSAAALGSIEIKKDICSVGEILRAVHKQCEPLFMRKEQIVSLSVCNDDHVQGDEKRLFQVFENILSNASKYSYNHTFITVLSERIDNTLRVSIHDQGQGLSDDDVDKLFGQFQKLSSLPTGGEHSTGLGLHIVKHIVELHNGKIWAESKGKGSGTTFIVELPVV